MTAGQVAAHYSAFAERQACVIFFARTAGRLQCTRGDVCEGCEVNGEGDNGGDPQRWSGP